MTERRQAAEQLAKRFGIIRSDAPASLADRAFSLEDLLADRANVGRARVAARIHHNASARQALNDLARAVRDIEKSGTDSRSGDDAA